MVIVTFRKWDERVEMVNLRRLWSFMEPGILLLIAIFY